VLAVLGSRLDTAARDLVSDWCDAGAVLLSAEDLTSEGWTFRVAEPGKGTAVIAGRRVRVNELQAVLTRRPGVLAEELTWIDVGDRAYVAAETNAFLVAWLSALTCPVVNQPTPASLCGPAWGRSHWAMAAARAGLKWAEESDDDLHDVFIAGEDCIGARSKTEAAGARALALFAQVELLGVRFVKKGVCGATARPRLDDQDVRAALLKHLVRDES
jgi:hypothetical protein